MTGNLALFQTVQHGMCLSPIGILRANHVIKPPPAVKIQRHFISNGPLRCPPARLRLPSRPPCAQGASETVAIGVNDNDTVVGAYLGRSCGGFRAPRLNNSA